MRLAESEGREVLILADANAHSGMWNSHKVSVRGEAFEDFIFENNLHVHNTGDRYTYVRYNAQSIIDITLITSVLAQRIKNWNVRDAIKSSDHCSIEMILCIDGAEKRTIRNFHKADWEKFYRTVAEKNPEK